MAVPFNHRAVEAKWRENWAKNPVNVDDGKKPKYYYALEGVKKIVDIKH